MQKLGTQKRIPLPFQPPATGEGVGSPAKPSDLAAPKRPRLSVKSAGRNKRLTKIDIAPAEPGIAVMFCCQNCMAFYRAVQKRSATIQSGSFECEFCTTEVANWSGSYSLSEWTPISAIDRVNQIAKPPIASKRQKPERVRRTAYPTEA